MDYKAIILEELSTLQKKEQQDGNTFKAIAYAKVIKQISLLQTVKSMSDLSTITGIGKSIQEKLEEIFKTGELKAAQEVKKDVQIPVVDQFMHIYGIGRVKANDLVKKKGIMSLEQLTQASRDDPSLLNQNQKIGLQFYHDFLERIPRAEMNKHNTLLQKHLATLQLEGEIVGSYRRGEKTSGDIDLLVKSDDSTKLQSLVDNLVKEGYMTHILALGQKKCMAVCRLGAKGVSRRLDILISPPSEYAFALLYFTGSDKFNIKMRKHALARNISLNEHGFTPAGPFMATEKDIFDYLEFPYVTPMDRKAIS